MNFGVSANTSATTAVPRRPVAGGVMIGWHERGDDVNLLRTNEAQLGTRFALVRMYQQWQVPSRKIGIVIGEGRLALVSHKPPAPPAGWAAVASGAEDRMIEALADAYRAVGQEVLFSFHHEPHDDASDVKGGTYGTAAEYRAAWRRIRDIFVARGAHHSAGGARNDWFRNAATWLRTDPLARRWMWGFAYFHTLHDTCPWDFLNQGDDGRLGWQDAFRDPYFTGTPFSLGSDDLRIEGAQSPPAAPIPVATQPPARPAAPATTTSTTRRITPTTGPTSAAPQAQPDPAAARAAPPLPTAAAPAPATEAPAPPGPTLPGEGRAAFNPAGPTAGNARPPLSTAAVGSAALLILGLAVLLRRVAH